ncbi:hypothetical protein NE237_005974 [Protea cynaroides]|uniref:Uncharacterized protein n=1 Tax=Protea cynaroides TaxID=273540 RepID=A0A9Q0KLS9_9MAGN|nr:hypothetical protein NE237_005974 [Protea cynaroides]
MDVLEEVELSNRGESDESVDTDVNEPKPTSSIVPEERPSGIQASRPARLQILNNVKLNNPFETPRSTIKGILKVSNRVRFFEALKASLESSPTLPESHKGSTQP